MQLRVIEGREDLGKADVVGVPVILGVGEDDDVVFGKGRHVLEWIMSFDGSVCQAGPVNLTSSPSSQVWLRGLL